jgi:hypothetical protein
MLRPTMGQSIGFSNSDHWPWIAGGVAASILAYSYLKSGRNSYAQSRGQSRLPGPKPVPIIGNVLDFPPNRWYDKFCEWQKEYGECIRQGLSLHLLHL